MKPKLNQTTVIKPKQLYNLFFSNISIPVYGLGCSSRWGGGEGGYTAFALHCEKLAKFLFEQGDKVSLLFAATPRAARLINFPLISAAPLVCLVRSAAQQLSSVASPLWASRILGYTAHHLIIFVRLQPGAMGHSKTQ